MAVRLAPAQWFRAALVAAVVAAVCVTVFDLTVSERVVSRAVAAEDAHGVHGALAVPEQFTRGEQEGGLVLAELLYAVGAAFVLAGVAILGGLVRNPAFRWVALSGAAAWSLAVAPAFALPPLPPGAEAAASIDARRLTYVSAVLIGAAGCVGAAWMWRRTESRRAAVRVLASATALAASAVIVLVALPGDRLVGEVDAALVRDFRLASFVSQALFWVACAAGGVLALRRPRFG